MVVVRSVSTRLGFASVKRKNQQTKQLKTTHELWFQVQDDRQRMQRVPRKQDGALSRTGRAVRSTSLGLDSDLGKRWLSEVGSS
jgi:hypothetical protein